jgi:Sel1 repeat
MSTRQLHVLTSIIVATWLASGCARGIFLSQTAIVNNIAYPEDLKRRIIEFKRTLDEEIAKGILDAALSNYVTAEPAVINDGLNYVGDEVVDDGTVIHTEGPFVRSSVMYHFERRTVYVPFSDIRHIRIAQKDYPKSHPHNFVDFVKDGTHTFRFIVRPDADETRLVASLLYLCKNLEDSSWMSFGSQGDEGPPKFGQLGDRTRAPRLSGGNLTLRPVFSGVAASTSTSQATTGGGEPNTTGSSLYAKGVERVKAGEPSQAADLFHQACDTADAKACTFLGRMYESGRGVAKDESRAIVLYDKACDAGDAVGCRSLGLMYGNGRGVAKDNVRAVALFGRACDAQDAVGCRSLGFMYENGRGEPKDDVRALALYAKACKLGDDDGCRRQRPPK